MIFVINPDIDVWRQQVADGHTLLGYDAWITNHSNALMDLHEVITEFVMADQPFVEHLDEHVRRDRIRKATDAAWAQLIGAT